MALSPSSSNASPASPMQQLTRALAYADGRVAVEQGLSVAQVVGYVADVQRFVDTLIAQNLELRESSGVVESRRCESEEASRGEIAALKERVGILEEMLATRQGEEAHRVEAIRAEVAQLHEMATAAGAQAKVAEAKIDAAGAATGAVRAELGICQATAGAVQAELSAFRAATEAKMDGVRAVAGAVRGELTVSQAITQTRAQADQAKFAATDAVIAQHEATLAQPRRALSAISRAIAKGR